MKKKIAVMLKEFNHIFRLNIIRKEEKSQLETEKPTDT